MKEKVIICTLSFGLASFVVADPAEELAEAAKKLASAKSYTWSSATVFGDREPRVTSGMTGAGGHTKLAIPMRDDSIEVVMRGESAVFKTDEGWRLASADAEGDENRRLRFLGRMLSNYEAPTARVSELVEAAEGLKAEEGAYVATLREETAKDMMSWRRRGGGDGPAISGASGSVKFSVKDGMVTKCELTLNGKVTFNDRERDISRTTTMVFREIGSTSFDIAEEAAGLLAGAGSSSS